MEVLDTGLLKQHHTSPHTGIDAQSCTSHSKIINNGEVAFGRRQTRTRIQADRV